MCGERFAHLLLAVQHYQVEHREAVAPNNSAVQARLAQHLTEQLAQRLQQQQQEGQGAQELIWYCKRCDLTFKCQQSLRGHLLNTHHEKHKLSSIKPTPKFQ